MKVDGRRGQNLPRRAQQPQHRANAELCRQHERRRAEARQDHCRAGPPAQVRHIVRAEGLGDGNGKPLRKPHGQAQPEPVEPVGAAQGRQGGKPDATAHHGGVDDGIQLLEQAPGHQGQGNLHDQRQRTAFGHILCAHGASSGRSGHGRSGHGRPRAGKGRNRCKRDGPAGHNRCGARIERPRAGPSGGVRPARRCAAIPR